MKTLIFAGVTHSQMCFMLDEAEIASRLGKEVVFVSCNKSIGQCMDNLGCNPFICHRCQRIFKKLSKQVSPQIQFISIDEYMSDDDRKYVEDLTFDYRSIADIKSIKYNCCQTGLGCLSTYISHTRNMSPSFDSEFRHFFDGYLKSTTLQAIQQEKIIDKIKPDEIIIFNGRISNVRPIVDLALNKNISFTTCELMRSLPGKNMKTYYVNTTPHDLLYNEKKIMRAWDDDLVSMEDKVFLGSQFYEKKVKGVFSGDTNYIKSQQAGRLPDGWDDTKHNIVVFNSSEDEFASVDAGFDCANLYDNQEAGIRAIAQMTLDNPNIQLYLRIHPHLKGVQYSYHTNLLKLGEEYSNLTVIPADSPVSSYALLQKSSKVVVFGSTVGIEAAYWGKPVINLAGSYYMHLGSTYLPTTEFELKKLITNENLPCLDKTGAMKYGYYYTNYKLPRSYYYPLDKTIVRFLGRDMILWPYLKILGSQRLYALYYSFTKRLFKENKIPTRSHEDI